MTLEFLQNFQNGHTMVRGKNIMVSEEIIAEVTGIPVEGTRWTDKHVLLQEAVTIFKYPDEQLVQKGKGVPPTALI